MLAVVLHLRRAKAAAVVHGTGSRRTKCVCYRRATWPLAQATPPTHTSLMRVHGLRASPHLQPPKTASCGLVRTHTSLLPPALAHE